MAGFDGNNPLEALGQNQEAASREVEILTASIYFAAAADVAKAAPVRPQPVMA